MEKFENKTAEEKIEAAKNENPRRFHDVDGSGMLLTDEEYQVWKKEHLESGETYKKD